MRRRPRAGARGRGWLRRGGAAVLALSLLPALGGCRRGAQQAALDVSRLQVTRYRYNIDETHETARILAEVTNFGTAPVHSAVVTAILRGPDGSARGQNSVTLEHVKAGEARVFSLQVTTHGRERDVDFQISTVPEAEQAAQSADGEGSATNAHD